MLHQIIHYLEIASILLCLMAVIGHVAWHHKEQGESCKKAGRPTSSSIKA